jgi:hypothetical protein
VPAKIPKDRRNKFWVRLEREIEIRAKHKDKNFKLKGKWKRFVRKQSGYSVYAVDGTWIRNNLSAYFGHGGHGLVHEFIPMDEIWISTHHYKEGEYDKISACGCTVDEDNQPTSKNYFDSTTLHEITECNEMKKGKGFWTAHNLALQAERKSKLLRSPHDDRIANKN